MYVRVYNIYVCEDCGDSPVGDNGCNVENRYKRAAFGWEIVREREREWEEKNERKRGD